MISKHLIWAPLMALALMPLVGSETLRERRTRVERMSAVEKEELQRKERRFHGLSEQEQQRLRQFEKELATVPDGTELRNIMHRYYDWLSTLPSGQRASILSLPKEERLSQIRALLERQSIQRFQRFVRTKLDDRDVPVIKNWVYGFVDRHRGELIRSLPEERRREIQSSPDQRRFLLHALLRGDAAVPVSHDELDVLASQLSNSAREVLQSETDPNRQTLLLRSWIEAVTFDQWARTLEPVSTEELMRFLQEEVSEWERAELEKLPNEPFRREAARLYHQHQFRKRWEQMRTQRNSEGNFPGFAPSPRNERAPKDRS